jgi:hypothetical protein
MIINNHGFIVVVTCRLSEDEAGKGVTGVSLPP